FRALASDLPTPAALPQRDHYPAEIPSAAAGVASRDDPALGHTVRAVARRQARALERDPVLAQPKRPASGLQLARCSGGHRPSRLMGCGPRRRPLPTLYCAGLWG